MNDCKKRDTCSKIVGNPYDWQNPCPCDQYEKEIDKYRWHDLRENPDDLPTDENRRYLIYATVKPIGENRYYTAKLIRTYDGFKMLTPSPFLDVDVIAWREIEPFEEVEENGETD